MLVEAHRHQTMAMMVCEGWSSTDIAEAMTLPESVVKTYLGAGAPESLKAIKKAYREKAERLHVERKFRMAEHSERGYQNIGEALISNDAKLKTETSWRVLDEVSPKPVVETAPA